MSDLRVVVYFNASLFLFCTEVCDKYKDSYLLIPSCLVLLYCISHAQQEIQREDDSPSAEMYAVWRVHSSRHNKALLELWDSE